MAHHQDKESLLEEVWDLKKALQAAKESNRQLNLQNKHMVADLKVLEEAVIDLQATRKDQGSPSRSGAPAQQSAVRESHLFRAGQPLLQCRSNWLLL
jgi:regulator of replication initiation timing